MMLSRSDLEREAASTGFQSESLEKVFRLLELLQSLRSHPFLKGRLVLKGGTALNLFLFLNDHGEIRPDLLTADETMQTTIRAHPGLQWKALNVRKAAGTRRND